MIKLSIIIPYYKTLKLTNRLLNMLIPQLTDETEVILIDDGCNQKELDEYKEIKVIHINNGGVSNARNIGLKEAKGTYITFIDSDDMIKPYYIEKILEKTKEQWDYCLMSWEAVGSINGEFIIKDNPPDWNTSIWNCIYKKDLIGTFDTSKTIAEDEDFNKRYRKGVKANITDIMYIYTAGRKDSLTNLYSRGLITNTIKCSLLIYQKALGHIGGVETWVNEFCQMYKDIYDITLVYRYCDIKQLKRLEQLVRCIKYEDQKFICQKYICASNQDNIADSVTSTDNYYAIIIQADYKAMKWPYRSHPKTNRHIAVSKVAQKGVTDQLPNTDIKVIYNTLNEKHPQRVLKLVTATRLSWEKGQARYDIFAERLNRLKIPFTWEIFTDDVPMKTIDGLVYRKGRYDIINFIAAADYYVSLSNTESWGYSTAEALEVGTPVICTNYPAIFEQGIVDGVNGYITDMELTNLNELIDKMYKNDLKGFKYKKLDSKTQWQEELGELEKVNEYIPREQVEEGTEVEVLIPTYYSVEKVQAKKGDIIVVTDEERLNMLVNMGYVKIIEV